MGLYMLLNVRIIAAVILICFGLYFLLPELTGIEAATLKMLWPALLIIVGIGIVLKGFNRRWCEKKNSYVKTEDLPYMTSTVIFGSEKKKLSSRDFEGAKLTAIFGGIVASAGAPGVRPRHHDLRILAGGTGRGAGSGGNRRQVPATLRAGGGAGRRRDRVRNADRDRDP